jgi:benzaldehyde dehydrogenase (NAD)
MTTITETTTVGGLLDADRWTGRLYGADGWADAPYVAASTEVATGEALGTIGVADSGTVAAMGAAAARIQPEWAALPFVERSAILRRAAETLERHAAEIAEWIVRESGSIPPKADVEIKASIGECLEAAALPSQPNGLLLPSLTPGRTSVARRVPLGVVGVIAPWNFPLILTMRSLAPALALGNAVIVKADPNTPVSGGVVVARMFEEAGLPPGVLQVFSGGVDVGEALVADPHVEMISFTGSTAAGRRVGEAAGRHLKRTALELGGNNPLIVLEDADVDAAASAGAWGSFLHQGQICMAAGRHIVHESIVEDYVEALRARAERLPVGDPHRDEVGLGPIINEAQVLNVQRIVDATRAAGGTALTGGDREGLYFPATVLRDVTPEMAAWSEEIFGPVAPVMSFGTEDEAIALANDTELGLSAAVQTSSPERGAAVAARLRAGMVHINDQTVNDEPNAPFSGFKASGNGVAFGGPANVEAFTEWQWVTSRDQATPFPF